MSPSQHDQELVASATGSRAQTALQPRVRTRHLQFIYRGYRVTALFVELATDMFKQVQAAFTIEGHAEDSACSIEPQAHAFDTHNNALRYARADAKRFIRADIAHKIRARSPLEIELPQQKLSDPIRCANRSQ